MKAAVIGLGTMGPGIAATLARGGLEVTCFDVSAEQMRKEKSSNCAAKSVTNVCRKPTGKRKSTQRAPRSQR